MELTTSLYLLRRYYACQERYDHLKSALGPTADKAPIALTTILELNGIDDALWALRAVPAAQRKERDKQARLFACYCVRNTPLGDGRRHWALLTDPRSREAVRIAERYAVGIATENELADAADASYAAYAAADAAYAAAYAAHADAAYAAAYAAHAAAADAAYAAYAADAADAAANFSCAPSRTTAARDAQARYFVKFFGPGGKP